MTKAEAIAMLKRIQEPEAWEPQINQAAFEALDMAIEALSQESSEDVISRQAAIDAHCELCEDKGLCGDICPDVEVFRLIPSAQPEPSEITDEQAILHLQSTGWMQNHDREMYGSGLREQLADDSGAYDSLVSCGDAISRQAAIDFIDAGHLCNPNEPRWSDNEVVNFLKSRPSAQPEQGDKAIFWKKRAREYEDIIADFVAEQAKGTKFDSITITEEGITFKKSQPERKRGKWIKEKSRGQLYQCSACGNYLDFRGVNAGRGSTNYCPNCGARMEQ